MRWNFYDMNVLGDGAVNVWLDEPFTATVECAEQVIVGSQTMTVTVTDPNGNPLKNYRCAIFMEDEVIAMGNTGEDGVVEIAFEDGLQNVGAMLMKVTGVNSYPQTVELMAVPSNTPYVVYESQTLNGGEQIEYGGSYSFNMTMVNVGSVNANNVTATLSTDSEYITIDQPEVNVGTVDGNQSVTLENAFAFTVSDDVPNNTVARFNLTCTDGTDVWESHFNVRIFAPEFELVSTVLESSAPFLNPGDSGIVHFVFRNKGRAGVPSARFDIFNSHPEINIPTTQWIFEAIAPDQEFSADMEFSISSSAVVGSLYELPFAVQHGHYLLSDSYYLPVGQSMDGFETGDFSAFDWHSVSPIYAWEVVTENPYEGSYCAKSSAIDDYETSALFITLDVATESEMSFYYKVSSESNFDKLYFKIDDTEKGNWSGEIDWSQASFQLTPGRHELRWEYSKDISVSSGSDCAWIDNVVFPAATLITMTTETYAHTPVVYPNPNNGSFSISLPEDDCQVTVFNSLGQIMHQCQGNGLTSLILNGLSNGMYFITVNSDTFTTTVKYIKE